uniref:Uncharacterized protein n=1 Tax=Arundo donax TaxID=35708 RepID=A0A0A9HAA6_ARUDO
MPLYSLTTSGLELQGTRLIIYMLHFTCVKHVTCFVEGHSLYHYLCMLV